MSKTIQYLVHWNTWSSFKLRQLVQYLRQQFCEKSLAVLILVLWNKFCVNFKVSTEKIRIHYQKQQQESTSDSDYNQPTFMHTQRHTHIHTSTTSPLLKGSVASSSRGEPTRIDVSFALKQTKQK
eukprot:m.47118 g.47118  ORF g.47118 m.47118 type:complete len:125 (-) comp10744_c0_seq5:805-1179(-)